MKRAAYVLLCATCVPVAVAAQPPPRVEDLRARATTYVVRFMEHFSHVVAEERLLQETTALPSVSGSGVNRRMDVATPQKREIRSDYLFIRRADTDLWHVYRDVFEVNGRPVRDRGDRLLKLLTAPSLTNDELARKIAEESSRYKIDPGLRNVDDPILPLVFLQPAYYERFRFTRGARDRSVGPDVWIVNYQEQARPTVVRSVGGDAPSSGRIWIDASTGRVLRSTLDVRTTRVEMTFEWNEAIGVAVPAEMYDSYTAGGVDYRARATYTNFRRFDVSTTEKVNEP